MAAGNDRITPSGIALAAPVATARWPDNPHVRQPLVGSGSRIAHADCKQLRRIGWLGVARQRANPFVLASEYFATNLNADPHATAGANEDTCSNGEPTMRDGVHVHSDPVEQLLAR